MCSRFEINVRAHELFERLGLTGDTAALDTVVPRAEVRPTDRMVLLHSSGTTTAHWGWDVTWSPKPLINARAETLTEKPTFRDRLAARCAVPATAYFEWRDPGDGSKKRRNRIARSDNNLIVFAGLTDASGHAAIITCAPVPSIAHIHGRMPAILEPDSAAAWLSDVPFEDVAGVLHPPLDVGLEATEDTPPPPQQGDLFG